MTGALGVLGGMGPLASAHFVRTIYELNCADHEQDMPRVLLDSDPGFPDRTTAIMQGEEEGILRLLASRVTGLIGLGATRIVVPCVTVHHFFERMEPALRAPIVSLVDLTVRELAREPGPPLLMLATTGTRRAGIFERAPGWDRASGRVIFPSQADQELIHHLIYQLKRGRAAAAALPAIDALRRRYDCAGIVVGCTEFHFVSQELAAAYGPQRVVDALRSIAADIVSVVDRSPAECP
jgi:aspartate racemase